MPCRRVKFLASHATCMFVCESFLHTFFCTNHCCDELIISVLLKAIHTYLSMAYDYIPLHSLSFIKCYVSFQHIPFYCFTYPVLSSSSFSISLILQTYWGHAMFATLVVTFNLAQLSYMEIERNFIYFNAQENMAGS